MTRRNLEETGGIPAVGYVRMSSERQEASPTQQRAAIEKLAARQGYHIIRWYADEAISGDATERRQQFQQMITDAEQGQFRAILCWDQDRFGRFDSIEAGRSIYPLRKAGVHLATVAQGVIDWNDFAGRMIYGIQQEAKHQFLQDLSRNTARGQIANALNGYLCGQAAPYGMDRMLVDESGQHRQRVHRGEKYVKPRGWHVTLVPSDDPVKVQTVRWLFKTYAETDIGYRALADELNRREIASPTDGRWYDSSVRATLGRLAYVGTFRWASRREGKYHRVAGDEILQRDQREVHLAPNGKPNAVVNPEEAWIIVGDAFEPLVNRATFEAVQAKIQRRSRKQGQGYRTHTRNNRDAYLLTGLVYCQHCDRPMHGSPSTRRKNGKTYKYHRYVCSTFTRGGVHNESGCRHYAIRQELIYDVILAKLRETLLAGGNMDRLRNCLRERLEQRCRPDTKQVTRLQRRLKQLDKQLNRFAKNWFSAPESLLPTLTAEAEAKKRERELVAERLQQAEVAAQPMDIEAQVQAAAERVWTLAEELKDAPPARLRELMQRLVERVEVSFNEQRRGKRREYRPVGGRILFRGESLGFADRGDPIKTTLYKLRVSREEYWAAVAS